MKQEWLQISAKFTEEELILAADQQGRYWHITFPTPLSNIIEALDKVEVGGCSQGSVMSFIMKALAERLEFRLRAEK